MVLTDEQTDRQMDKAHSAAYCDRRRTIINRQLTATVNSEFNNKRITTKLVTHQSTEEQLV